MQKNKKVIAFGSFAIAALVVIGILGYSTNFQTKLVGKITQNNSKSTEVDGDDAVFVSQTIPTALQPGETVQISVTMKNFGVTVWTADQNYKLATAIDPNDLWGTSRVSLDQGEEIEPLQEKVFVFDITAPMQDGTYNVQWKMLKETEHHFGAPSEKVSITVGSGTVSANNTAANTSAANTSSSNYTVFPDSTVENFVLSLGCEYLQCNTNGCRCASAVPTGSTCTTAADCLTGETCTNGQCEIAGGGGNGGTGTVPVPSSITGSLALSAHDAVYDVLSPTEKTPKDITRGPQASAFLIDPEDAVGYVTDHIGYYRYAFNGLQDAQVKQVELLGSIIRDAGGHNTSCLIKAESNYVSRCIVYGGDTAGYEGSRLLYPSFVDKHEVMGQSKATNSHSNTWLMFGDTDGSFEVDTEFIPSTSLGGNDTSKGAVAREGGGVAYLGGLAVNEKKDFVMFFAPDNKKYVLARSSESRDSEIDNTQLYDITNSLTPQNLGTVGSMPQLSSILKVVCMGGKLWPGTNLCRTEISQTPEKMAIVKEGTEHVLYDYNDPTNIIELARWTNKGSFSYEGPVNGTSATVSNGILYVNLKALNQNEYNKSKMVNPKELKKCFYDSKSGPRPCYYGQVWKLPLGNDTWEKVLDVPARTAIIHDGKLFIKDNIFDPNNEYDYNYGTRTYKLNINNEKELAVYDLENGNWMMQTPVYEPEKCKGLLYTPSYVATTKGDKYYVYSFLKNCGGTGEIAKTYIWGYELSQCSGAADCGAKTTGNNPVNTCIPSCSGQSCGGSDGCGGYCNTDNSCQQGFECLPRFWADPNTQPRCMCPFGSQYNTTQNANCTVGTKQYSVTDVLSDGRCIIKEETCSGVSGCNYWQMSTSNGVTYWRDQLEASYPNTQGIEQCSYKP